MNNIKLALLDHFTLQELKDEHDTIIVDSLYAKEPRFQWEVESDILKEIQKLKDEINHATATQVSYVRDLPKVVQDVLVATQAKLLSDNGLKRMDVDLYTDDMLNSKISDLDELLYLVKDSIDYK